LQSRSRTKMPTRSSDNRLKQLHHEKAERVKKGIDRLERQSSNKLQSSPKKGGHGGKGVWGSPRDDISDYSKEDKEDTA